MATGTGKGQIGRMERADLWIKYKDVKGPMILAYGTFNKGTYVWHGQKTTPDTARYGHIQVIKSFHPATTQCCVNQQFTNGGFIPNTRCTNNAEIGAHVYFNNDKDASAKICQIIPTCNRHNNVFGNAKRGQNFLDQHQLTPTQGVEVVDGTPFIVRLMAFEECEKKGKGGGRGEGKTAVSGVLPKFVDLEEHTRNLTYCKDSSGTEFGRPILIAFGVVKQ